MFAKTFSFRLLLSISFMTLLVVISAWEVIQYKVAQYMASFLIMEGLMIGVFAAMDAVLFYVFWEAMAGKRAATAVDGRACRVVRV